ncbi:hypothetical protein QN365_23100, partial [Pseudomonas sp. RTI1]
MLNRLKVIFENSRFLQLFIITACIQGGVIVSQFMVTPWIDPSVLGVIRSLETVIALVVLAGSLGMQSIAVRDTAEREEYNHQNSVLRRVFVLIGIASAIVIVTIFVVHTFLISTAISSYVLSTCGLVLITNLLRASTGFAQGVKATRNIYLILMIVSSGVVVLHVVLTRLYGIHGWIVARYTGELLCLLAVWWRLKVYVVPALDMRGLNLRDLISTARSGVTINASLFVRLFVDSLPVLMLTALHIKTEEIGYFGIAILSLVLGFLPLAIIAQRAIPDFVEVLNDKMVLKERYASLTAMMVKVSLGFAAMLIALSLLWLVVGRASYRPAAMYMIALALAMPLKAISLSCGTMLVALRVFDASLKINILEGVLVLGVLYVGVPTVSYTHLTLP